MPVIVETVLLSLRHNELWYRTRTAHLPDGGHPDTLARELAGFAAPGRGGMPLLHSTSWRFAGDAVVLTYAALPDPYPDGAVALGPVAPAPYSDDPLSPAAVALTVRDVVVHACRHLAYLHRTDPLVADVAGADPELWGELGAFAPGLAGLVSQPA